MVINRDYFICLLTINIPQNKISLTIVHSPFTDSDTPTPIVVYGGRLFQQKWSNFGQTSLLMAPVSHVSIDDSMFYIIIII